MRRLIPIGALILTMAMGCTNPFDDDDDSGSDAAARYFPLKIGATWTYGPADENAEYDAPYTETVTGTAVYRGKTYWTSERVIARDTSRSEVDTSYIRTEGNTVYAAILGDWFFNKPASGAEEIVLLSEYPQVKFGIGSGSSWVVYTYADTTGEIQSEEITTVTFLGAETLTVPAGTFAGCLKMRTVCTGTWCEVLNGVPGTRYTHTDRSTLWYAPNVGIVKKLHEQQESTPTPDEEWDHVRTYVLTGWDFPD